MQKSIGVTHAVVFVFVSSILGGEGRTERPLQVIAVKDGVGLQQAINQPAVKGFTVRIDQPITLTCRVQESMVENEVSRHALLIPPSVDLDLNQSTLRLDLRSNSHGVRLSSRSSIRNGTIEVIRSEQKGSQSIWHSGISVGAPYDDGGTPERPGYFSKVSHWKIEDVTIDQQVSASAIQLMSEACHGVIRRVEILDSSTALMGIGMDWGSVGTFNTADDKISSIRKRWENWEIYTTHPHDILIDDVKIGHLGRNIDGNDAGIRCSACYNIRIQNVHVASAASAVAIFGGDCGFEFAPRSLRPQAHTGYQIHGVVIEKAFRYGMVLNGLADNVFRASQKYGYRTLLDPAHPGLEGVRVANCQLSGGGTPKSQGMFITAVSDLQVRDVSLTEFSIGARIKDWVTDLHFRNSDLSQNESPVSIFSRIEKPKNLFFE